MIVKSTAQGWEVIYHRAHALLAAQLAGHWRHAARPPHSVEIIAAISDHDDLEREWEGDHLSAAGAPLDFTLVTGANVEKLRRHMERTRYRGRRVALLTSMHMSFLNEPQRGTSRELDAFLDEQRARQREWRKALGVSQREADSAYAFFQWCDQLSLILCQGSLPAGGRELEIGVGPDGERYFVRQRADTTVEARPWPFEEARFSVEVEACELAQERFASNDELIAALQTAPIRTLVWEFAR